MKPTTARIISSSSRHATWLRVFGTDTVPIKSPVPVFGTAPGMESQWFLHVNVQALTPDQRARAVEYLSGKFGLQPAEVEANMDHPEHGLPIPAKDLQLVVDPRLLL